MVPIKRWWNNHWRLLRRILIILLSIFGCYTILYWINDASPVVIFDMGEATPAAGKPGEVMIFHQPIHKNRTCWGMVRRIIIGDCGLFIISESPSWLPAPWHGRLTYAVQIPTEAIPGSCGFQLIGRFICNPLDFMGKPRWVASTPIAFQVLRYDQAD